MLDPTLISRRRLLTAMALSPLLLKMGPAALPQSIRTASWRWSGCPSN